MSPVTKQRAEPRHVWQGVIAEYRDRLPVTPATPVVTLREGGTPPIYSTANVRRALTEGLSILPVLAAYGPVDWREVTTDAPLGIADRAGTPTGVSLRAFAVASKPPGPLPLPGRSISPKSRSI